MKLPSTKSGASIAALGLAIRLNQHAPTGVTRSLVRQWQGYFHACQRETRPLFVISRMIRCFGTLRFAAEFRLIVCQRQVCALAYCDYPNLDAIADAINNERDAWGKRLLGKCWNPVTAIALRSAVQDGVPLNEIVRAIRTGQLRVNGGELVPPTIRPVAAGILIATANFGWFAMIAYKMAELSPNALSNSIVMLAAGTAGGLWFGYTHYAMVRDEKNIVLRILASRRPRVVQPPQQ